MKWFLFAAVGAILLWEGAAEINRLSRWHNEDASWWRRRKANNLSLDSQLFQEILR